MHRKAIRLVAGVVVLSGGIMVSSPAVAGGYYYEARSFYVAAPIVAYPPVYRPQPIVVYEQVVAPPIVVGYVISEPAPVLTPVYSGRVRERWHGTPWHSRYKYQVSYPGGLDYEYGYKRDLGRVRYYEKWDR